jgi:hypothetical protein
MLVPRSKDVNGLLTAYGSMRRICYAACSASFAGAGDSSYAYSAQIR